MPFSTAELRGEAGPRLGLGGRQLDNLDAAFITGFLPSTGLTCLTLSGNRFSDSAMAMLLNVLPLTGLLELDISQGAYDVAKCDVALDGTIRAWVNKSGPRVCVHYGDCSPTGSPISFGGEVWRRPPSSHALALPHSAPEPSPAGFRARRDSVGRAAAAGDAAPADGGHRRRVGRLGHRGFADARPQPAAGHGRPHRSGQGVRRPPIRAFAPAPASDRAARGRWVGFRFFARSHYHLVEFDPGGARPARPRRTPPATRHPPRARLSCTRRGTAALELELLTANDLAPSMLGRASIPEHKLAWKLIGLPGTPRVKVLPSAATRPRVVFSYSLFTGCVFFLLFYWVA
jgi:hypothetical protein